MVVHEDMSTVAEGDGVCAAVVVGQLAELHGAPCEAAVVALGFKDAILFGSAESEQFVRAEKEDAWLDGCYGAAVVHGADLFPCFSEIGGEFEVGCPAAWAFAGFVAGGAEDVAVRELDGFVLDGAEEAVGQALGGAPCGAAIGAGFEFAPP